MTENVRRSTLDNGVRVVTESISHVQSISLGIWVAAGSRDEEPSVRGISHFLEHMIFKGTERRPTAKQIADEMDAVGGYLNAFTDKEYTCYYARALSEHQHLALDLLTDMFTGSRFDPEETTREQKVVLEEIKRRDDDPEDLVHDLFAETLYPDHPLGLPVIGTAQSVLGLTPDALRAYLTRRCGPENVIVAAAGNLDHERVLAGVQEALGGLNPGQPRASLPATEAAIGRLNRYSRPTEQVNLCLGTAGCGHYDDDRYALALLDAVVGGSMGSRLFQEVREKRGLAYSVGSYTANFREGGYFAAYAGTSLETYEECVDIIRAELEKVRAEGVTAEELSRAKNQFRGSIVMAQESMSSRMNRLGKSEAIFGRVVPLAEVLAAIDAVTTEAIHRIAERRFRPDALTLALVGPFDPAHREELAAHEETDA
jgi:predicted Zn-dependent peptidase